MKLTCCIGLFLLIGGLWSGSRAQPADPSLEAPLVPTDPFQQDQLRRQAAQMQERYRLRIAIPEAVREVAHPNALARHPAAEAGNSPTLQFAGGLVLALGVGGVIGLFGLRELAQKGKEVKPAV